MEQEPPSTPAPAQGAHRLALPGSTPVRCTTRSRGLLTPGSHRFAPYPPHYSSRRSKPTPSPSARKPHGSHNTTPRGLLHIQSLPLKHVSSPDFHKAMASERSQYHAAAGAWKGTTKNTEAAKHAAEAGAATQYNRLGLPVLYPETQPAGGHELLPSLAALEASGISSDFWDLSTGSLLARALKCVAQLSRVTHSHPAHEVPPWMHTLHSTTARHWEGAVQALFAKVHDHGVSLEDVRKACLMLYPLHKLLSEQQHASAAAAAAAAPAIEDPTGKREGRYGSLCVPFLASLAAPPPPPPAEKGATPPPPADDVSWRFVSTSRYLKVMLGDPASKLHFSEYAHRLLLWVLVGPPPPGPDGKPLECIHCCDQKCCLNPLHLVWATHQQNMQRSEAAYLSALQREATSMHWAGGSRPLGWPGNTPVAKPPTKGK